MRSIVALILTVAAITMSSSLTQAENHTESSNSAISHIPLNVESNLNTGIWAYAVANRTAINSIKQSDINIIDKQLDDCLAKHFSTAEMIDCADAAYEAWDKELNRTYNELMKELPPRAKTLLKLSELDWVKYRDKDFALNDEIYSHAMGSMYRPMRIIHRIDVVKARALLLKELLDVPNDS